MIAWSLVDPPSHPFSNPPLWASITKIAHSAYEAPVIMFPIKSTWPGQSIIEKFLFLVEKESLAVFIVIPLFLSSAS